MLRPAPLLAAALAALLAACATPVAPSGGPPDTVPPTLVSSVPASGATRVAGRQVVLTFSERLDAASAARAVQVTPQTKTRVSVRGRDLVVDFPALRDSTTYVVTVASGLADARRVATRAPVVVAFATGDQIDRGQIAGVVRLPETGGPAAGLAVLAYADTTLADSLAAPRRADYATETGPDGAFRLDFLRAGRYLVVAVRDRNRDGRPDDGEPFAAPPQRTLRATVADSTAPDSAQAAAPRVAAFTLARLDTVPPAPRSVRALSDRRVAVRFTESVLLESPRAFAVEDSASGRAVGAVAYVRPEAPAEVVVVADAALAATPHRVRLAGTVTDSAGVAALPFARSFTPRAAPDTVRARIVAFEPVRDSARVLVPGQSPVVRWSAPPDSSLLARVRVAGPDSAAVPVRFETDDGLAFRLLLPDAPGVYTVADRDTVRVARFRRLGPDDVGSIVGRAEGDSVVVEAARDGAAFGPDAPRARADGSFEIPNLRPGTYRLRVFADRDGDGRWSGGQLFPYIPPEPLRFPPETIDVRARWDADVGTLAPDP